MSEASLDALGGAPWGPPRGPLEAFVARAKAARGDELLVVLEEALLHPEVFVFGELLALENVQALGARKGQGGPLPEMRPRERGPQVLLLLRLMASGTVEDLREMIKKQEIERVHPMMLYKIRLLTVVSLASVSSCVPFVDLQNALEAPDCCTPSGAPLGLFRGPQRAPIAGECGDGAEEGNSSSPTAAAAAAAEAAAAATAKASLDLGEVEEIVLFCLRLGLVRGRINGELACLCAWGALSRDPTERDIRAMISILKSFDARLLFVTQKLKTAAHAIHQ